jgi:hypothetical protein
MNSNFFLHITRSLPPLEAPSKSEEKPETVIKKGELLRMLEELAQVKYFDPTKIRTPIWIYFLLAFIIVMNIVG